MERGGFVYILASLNNKMVYVGVTSDLLARIYEHKTNKYPNSFTARYHIHKLVYYETFSGIEEAIDREKQIKKWRREKKDYLISLKNPEWKNLESEIADW